jgi:outer membrane protein TolC
MKFIYFFLVVLLLSVNCSHAQEADSLESMIPNVNYNYLDKLIATAKMNYPKMKVNETLADVGKLNLQKAKMDWLSIFTFTYLYSPAGTASLLTSSNPYLLNGYQVGFGISLGAVVERPTIIRTARDQYKIAQLNLDEYNLNIEATVKQRYYTYIQQQVELHWRIKNMQGAESILKEVKFKFEKGLEVFDTYNRAQTAYSAVVQAKIENESAYLSAKSSLEEILGAKLESIK